MRVSRIFMLFFFGLATLAWGEPISFDRQVDTVLTALIDKMSNPSDAERRVYIQPPVYLDDNRGAATSNRNFIGGPFAIHLQAALEKKLPRQFDLIPRDDLEAIWSEVKLAQVATTKDPEEMLIGLEALVKQQVTLPLDVIIMAEYGEWFNDPCRIRINLYLIDVPRVRKYTETAVIDLTREQCQDAPARPTGLERLRQYPDDIGHVVRDEVPVFSTQDEPFSFNEAENAFGLFITVDRGNGAVYEEGAPLTVYVASDTDCYIAIVNEDATGVTHLLFPNRYEQDNFIPDGSGRQIPSPQKLNHYDFGIRSPFGLEVIKVFASQTPFSVEGVLQDQSTRSAPLPALGSRGADGMAMIRQWAKSIIVRDKQQVKFAEAQCVFTTTMRSSRGIW
jgi:hypothetical protein